MRNPKTNLVATLAVLALTSLARGQTTAPSDRESQAWMAKQVGLLILVMEGSDVSYDSLAYQAPNRMVLMKPRISRPDKSEKGKLVPIFTAEQVVIDLAEPPIPGTPIRIESVKMARPMIAVRLSDRAGLAGTTSDRAATKRAAEADDFAVWLQSAFVPFVLFEKDNRTLQLALPLKTLDLADATIVDGTDTTDATAGRVRFHLQARIDNWRKVDLRAHVQDISTLLPSLRGGAEVRAEGDLQGMDLQVQVTAQGPNGRRTEVMIRSSAPKNKP